MKQGRNNNVFVRVENEVVITSKDVDLVQAISNGETANEIAKSQKISHRTIEGRIAQLKMKTGAKNLPSLVATFMRQKLIQ